MKIDHVSTGENPPYDTSLFGQIPVFLSAVIRSGSIGILIMGDKNGLGEKILCVPVDGLHPFYANIGSYRNILLVMLDPLSHFFGHYKDVERGKCFKVQRSGEAEEAVDPIRQAMTR